MKRFFPQRVLLISVMFIPLFFSGCIWSKTSYESGVPSRIIQTNDGGYLVAGNLVCWDCVYWESLGYLEKVSASGESQWKFFHHDYENIIKSVEQTSDGGYVFADGINCRKLDSNGNVQWIADNFTERLPVLVSQTNDGGYILYGAELQLDNLSIFINGISPDGTLINENIFPLPEKYNILLSHPLISPMAITSDKGLISLAFDEHNWNNGTLLIKISRNGELLFQKNLANPYFTVKETADKKGYLLLYFSLESEVDDPSRLARTDEYGNIVWEKNYSGTNNEPLVIYDVSETKDGGLIMAATTSDEEQVPYSILIKTNSAGEELWRKKIFDYTNATSVIQAKDGGFVVGGMYDFKKDDSADWKAFIAKTDSRGFTMPLFN